MVGGFVVGRNVCVLYFEDGRSPKHVEPTNK